MNIRSWQAGVVRFKRPVVLFQCDDWGRTGVRDEAGASQLREAGIELGAFPYDYFTLETADDLGALFEILGAHHDSVGRSPCLVMNSLVSNVDFARTVAGDFQSLHCVPIADGWPAPWERPGLREAYAQGVASHLLYPALHGTTHFCRQAVERAIRQDSARGEMIRAFFRSGSSYVFPRMPWIGFEFFDASTKDARFLSFAEQTRLVGDAAEEFKRLFGRLPLSACAPGYHANNDTQRAYVQHGIRVIQHGPTPYRPPRFDSDGVLHLHRNVVFEPAVDPGWYTVERAVAEIEARFADGAPAIVCIHSINLHSTLRNYRRVTLARLDELLRAIEQRHPGLLYLHDGDLYDMITTQEYSPPSGAVQLEVPKS